MKIRVTAKDINRGLRDNPTRCPIAKAIRRVGFPKIVVWGNKACNNLKGKAESTTITLPKRVINFVHRFDNEYPVKPFSFNLTKKQVAILRGE